MRPNEQTFLHVVQEIKVRCHTISDRIRGEYGRDSDKVLHYIKVTSN